MKYKIITFLLLAELLTGFRNGLLKVVNFFSTPPPSYSEVVSGRYGLNASNGVIINENTRVLRSPPPPAYSEVVSGRYGLNASNGVIINENTRVLRSPSPPAYSEVVSGRSGLNASNDVTINENTGLLRSTSPSAYSEVVSGRSGLNASNDVKKSVIILASGVIIMISTIALGIIIAAANTNVFGLIK